MTAAAAPEAIVTEVDLDRPVCPACRSAMRLSVIEPYAPGRDCRTFECMGCRRVRKVVVAYD